VRGTEEADANSTSLRFEVTVAPGLVATPRSGRLLVVLSRQARPEPRLSIGRTGVEAPPVVGKDWDNLVSGASMTVDQSAVIFPIASLAKLPAGEYSVQAVFHDNRDLNLPNAPGNLYSPVHKATLDPAAGGTLKLELSQQIPAEEMPKD